MLRIRASGGLVGGLLSGCTLFTPTPPADPHNLLAWQGFSAQQQSKTQAFDLQGRVASSQLLGIKASVRWQQRQNQFDIYLSGPLGLGSAQLVGTPEQVQIRSKGGTLISQNPEADLQQIAGFSLPIEPLRYWVLALPHPDHDYHVEADAEGRTLKLWQDGWQVEYLEYQGVLPKKMVAVKDDVTLRFFSDQWAFPAP